ncbi:hypothetical protein CGCTS75_v001503 [Colletotrichum tropicale]|nr:hypothetical protein CGCTS75_v001503 [Colletotrichum tropicale]
MSLEMTPRPSRSRYRRLPPHQTIAPFSTAPGPGSLPSSPHPSHRLVRLKIAPKMPCTNDTAAVVAAERASLNPACVGR